MFLPAGPDPETHGSTATANPDGSAGEAARVAASPLQRLGKLQLENTLRALLPGLPGDFDMAALPEDNDIQMAFALPGIVSDVEVKRFMELSERVLAGLGDAAPSATFACGERDEAACARAFIESFGKRAYRRPLAREEVGDLSALYDQLRQDPELGYDLRGALGVIVEAMLQSPGFLYRWERGLQAPERDGDLIKYDSYEMASRLSYYLWRSMPDQKLFDAAEQDVLRTPEQIASHALRMLADPRADRALSDFITQWLELRPLARLLKDTNAYPEFRPELRPAMHDEVVRFAREVLRGDAPTFTALMTARSSFAEEALADYYDTPDGARGGLLTLGALMAVKGNSYRTSPVRRGKFIINRVLCTVVLPPPDDVVTELPPPDPNLTLRAQMAEHRDNPRCASCHEQMDALGFAFEHFDGAGRYRERDGTQPIDASGQALLDGASVPFEDARELAAALARSPSAQACFARQWLRYAIDRFEQTADQGAVAHLEHAHEAAGLDTQKLIVEVTRTLPFTHRAPSPGEMLE